MLNKSRFSVLFCPQKVVQSRKTFTATTKLHVYIRAINTHVFMVPRMASDIFQRLLIN